VFHFRFLDNQIRVSCQADLLFRTSDMIVFFLIWLYFLHRWLISVLCDLQGRMHRAKYHQLLRPKAAVQGDLYLLLIQNYLILMKTKLRDIPGIWRKMRLWTRHDKSSSNRIYKRASCKPLTAGLLTLLRVTHFTRFTSRETLCCSLLLPKSRSNCSNSRKNKRKPCLRHLQPLYYVQNPKHAIKLEMWLMLKNKTYGPNSKA
jgi:hypothetical protein